MGVAVIGGGLGPFGLDFRGDWFRCHARYNARRKIWFRQICVREAAASAGKASPPVLFAAPGPPSSRL
jgi:hypothetical protein